MKRFYCLLLLLCPYMSYSQPLPEGLGIGEKFPGGKAKHVLNHTATSIDLSAYKGRLLVLDFIRTTCSGCLEKLDAYKDLQNQFNDKLAVVLVTKESQQVVQAYMKRANAKKLHFPIITTDEKLSELFPYESLSHLVWIGQEGKVKAITEGDWLVAENVMAALATDSLGWPVKRDIPFFDYNSSLLTMGEQAAAFTSKPKAYTAMLGYLPDVTAKFSVVADSASGTVTWRFINQSVLELYTRIYRKFRYPLSRVILHVNDIASIHYLDSYGPHRAWKEKYSRSFEAVLPFNIHTQNNLQKIQQSLDAFLGLQTSFVVKPTRCIIISPIPGQTIIQNKAGMALWGVTNMLNQQFTQQPVLLASDSLNKIRINISADQVKDKALLQQRLLEAGFEMLTETREIEMLMISENSSPN